jgi:catechol 2,3-dioxygenase-like lactoylglutathione lyase family enzyme
MLGAMAQHLNLLTIGVADLARSRSFYVDGLGWEVAFENDEVVFVHLGHGLLLGLFGASDLAADAGVGPLTPGSGSMSLANNVGTADEVDAVVELAAVAGATVVTRPQRAAFGGYHGYFTDPDGVLWEVAHNPGFVIGADGRVTIGEIAS